MMGFSGAGRRRPRARRRTEESIVSETRIFPNYINGEWVESDRKFENRNPRQHR